MHSLLEKCLVFYFVLDVLNMVDVILEAGEGDIEEMGPSLTDNVILQTFPFSVIVPAVLEARNNLLASLKQKRGNDVLKIDNRHRNIGMVLRAHSLDTEQQKVGIYSFPPKICHLSV